MRKEGRGKIEAAPEHNMENKPFSRMAKSNLHSAPNHLGDRLMEEEGHMIGYHEHRHMSRAKDYASHDSVGHKGYEKRRRDY